MKRRKDGGKFSILPPPATEEEKEREREREKEKGEQLQLLQQLQQKEKERKEKERKEKEKEKEKEREKEKEKKKEKESKNVIVQDASLVILSQTIKTLKNLLEKWYNFNPSKLIEKYDLISKNAPKIIDLRAKKGIKMASDLTFLDFELLYCIPSFELMDPKWSSHPERFFYLFIYFLFWFILLFFVYYSPFCLF